MAMEEQQGRPQPGVQYCYRHPDRETGISCTRCGRPVCPDCMVTAAVGFQCPECVRGGSGTGHALGADRPRNLAGGPIAANPRLITSVLLGLNVAVFLLVLGAGGQMTGRLAMLGHVYGYAHGTAPPEMLGVAAGEWYRLLTSAFLHREVWHIGLNMMALWLIGTQVEAALGRWRFLALYLLSALGGSALTYLLAAPDQPSLGASGAVFGLFGALAVLVRRMRYDVRPVLVLLVINLVFTFTVPNIAWEAHIGGLATGAAIAYAMVNAPRRLRAPVQYGTCALVLLAVAAICVLRTVQLTG